jgi:hypothetical protein
MEADGSKLDLLRLLDRMNVRGYYDVTSDDALMETMEKSVDRIDDEELRRDTKELLQGKIPPSTLAT